MSKVTVSPQFEVEIPQDIRELTGIHPGQELEVFEVGGIIELVPVNSLKSMRGSLPGLCTDVVRTDRVFE